MNANANLRADMLGAPLTRYEPPQLEWIMTPLAFFGIAYVVSVIACYAMGFGPVGSIGAALVPAAAGWFTFRSVNSHPFRWGAVATIGLLTFSAIGRAG